MQFTLTAATVAALFVAGADAAFTVSTPSSLVQCQPYLISWTGGTAPFYPEITKAQTVSSVIETFPSTSESSYSWTVNQAVGDTVTIVVVDSTGAMAISGTSPAVAAGSSSSCTTSSASSGSTATSSASSSASAASSSSSSTTSGASTLTQNIFLALGAAGLISAVVL